MATTNNSWSSNAITNVIVNKSGGSSDCSVSGSGTYSYNNIVTLTATAASGCEFLRWSDGCKLNPRRFYATGGSYSFTAEFSDPPNPCVVGIILCLNVGTIIVRRHGTHPGLILRLLVRLFSQRTMGQSF